MTYTAEYSCRPYGFQVVQADSATELIQKMRDRGYILTANDCIKIHEWDVSGANRCFIQRCTITKGHPMTEGTSL